MIITPTHAGLQQLVADSGPFFDQIRNYGDSTTRERILSALYLLADIKSSTLRSAIGDRGFTALTMSFGPDDRIFIGVKMQDAFVPLLVALHELILHELLRMRGPDAKPDPEFANVLAHAFLGNHTPVYMGEKKAFFGGTKPDIRRMSLPLVAGIEEVLWR
ncbi:hypothetical protein [Prosthecobacter sp.]|uniref:hypothetical protein n=1 Tax=Prosthecobacter sp. TaxID=1965333 RepID=UPI002ABA00FC|nr:hypothetical protein [Prosthecobacter sp.]MDZ4403844.1 hypothetical protein [Prosthecobacter sp.]